MLNEKGASLKEIAEWTGVPSAASCSGVDLADSVRRLRSTVAMPYLTNSDWSKPKVAEAAAFVREATLDILGGGEACHLTQGGTESGFLALFAAREAYAHVSDPEILIPWSAHPLFDKAGHLLRIRVKRIAETPDHRVDIAAMEAAITPNTIALAGSLPAWPFGVVDPLPEIGALAEKHGLWFHVDGSIGGMLFPFLEDAADWMKAPMQLPAVRSVSADQHKYGYAPTGLSSVAFRHVSDAAPLSFHWTDWPGLPYGTESLAGTRTSAPVMGAAAVFKFLGREGFLALAREHRALSSRIADAACAHKGWRVAVQPDGGTIALAADEASVSAVLDALTVEGRALRYTLSPYAIHSYANPVNPADVGFPEQIGRILGEVLAA